MSFRFLLLYFYVHFPEEFVVGADQGSQATGVPGLCLHKLSFLWKSG